MLFPLLMAAVTIPYSEAANGKTQVTKDQRGDDYVCAPYCDIKTASTTQQGKRIKFVVRYWHPSRDQHYSAILVSTNQATFWISKGKATNRSSNKSRRIRNKRRPGVEIHFVPLKLIGNPSRFRWAAKSGCCGIWDRAPNQGQRRFKVRESKPKSPVYRIKFDGDQAEFNVRCSSSEPCVGSFRIRKNGSDLVEPESYNADPGGSDTLTLRLRPLGRRILAREGKAQGLGTLRSTTGETVRFTAILTRKGKPPKPKPDPLPKELIRFGGGKGRFTVKCASSTPCAGRLTITKGKMKLVKPQRYRAKAGGKDVLILRLTKAGRKALAKKGHAKGLMTLTATDGDKARFTAILKKSS